MRTKLKLICSALMCLAAWLLSGGATPGNIQLQAYAQQICLPPKANAGPDQTVQIGQTVHLDGNQSSQASSCSGSLTYAWSFISKPSGSQATLSDSAVSKPTFVADIVGEFKLRLTVKNQVGSDADLVTITSTAQQSINAEFNSSTLDAAVSTYIPKAGPTFDLTANPGHLRLDLPGNTAFDHWTGVDEAPQLRLTAPTGNWEMTTKLRVLRPTTNANYHAALMVVFSRFDLFYWGIYQSAEIRMERSGSQGVFANRLSNPSSQIELLIAKNGSEYSFSYRLEGSSTWTEVGRLQEAGAPLFVGLIGKTWSPVQLTVDFDYLRVSSR
jgi:hypothetical protein